MSDGGPTEGAVLAVDIGGTHLRAGLVREDFTAHQFEIVSSLHILEVEDPSAALIAFVTDYLGRRTSGAAPLAISIGFPATVSRDRRTVLSATNIRSMQNLPIADTLEVALGVPAFIDRDVNMVLRHDMNSLHVPRQGVTVGCYLGTGLGNAISINGEILVGRHGVAGELGHLPVHGLSLVCGCGNTGCIETVASGRYFAEMANRTFPGTPLGEVLPRHSNHPRVLEFLHYVAVAIASEVNILDPEAVVLGGGVVQAHGFPRETLEADVRELARKPYPSEDITFLYSKGGQQAGVIGAGIYAWDALHAGLSPAVEASLAASGT